VPFFAPRDPAPPDRAVAVDQVRLVPQRALPFGGLLEEVMPGDLAVVRRVEPAIIDGLANRLVHVANEAAVDGEAGEDRQIAFGDAERLADLPRVAPFRDDLPPAQDEPVRAAARSHGAEHGVPRRRFLELPRDLDFEVAAPFRLAFRGVARRRVMGGGTALFPRGGVGGRNIVHAVLLGARLDFTGKRHEVVAQPPIGARGIRARFAARCKIC